MRLKVKKNLTLKPVHPTAVEHHGLFGHSFVRQHMLVDEKWTPDSLKQQFRKMSQLLKKHAQFHLLEKEVQGKKIIKVCHNMQKECRDGRTLLTLLRAGKAQQIRNILKDHRHMQRLYQKMPLDLIVENINNRTFVMRRERDRLESDLKKLEKIYSEKLIEKGKVENRISYENEFKLLEDEKITALLKTLQNSKLRLKANMTINATYKRILHILKQDETFYLPIIRSLEADVEDQSKFIKHILLLGSPALTRFQELSEQYKLLDDKARKSRRQSISEFSRYGKLMPKAESKEIKPPQRNFYVKAGRYARETKSMLQLKSRFEEIEETINQIQIATICPSEKLIYPRIKHQMKNNLELGSKIENNMLGQVVWETKMKCASVLQGVLENNYDESEIMRLERINKLKEAIKEEDKFEKNLLEYIKSYANIFVLIRMSLWNLHEIMKYVGPRQIPRLQYPEEYLKLPLLKYEMLTMKAYPPDAFEEDITKLLTDVYSKLQRLTKAFNWKLNETSINNIRKQYCEEMLNVTEGELLSTQDTRYQYAIGPETDMIDEVRSYKTVLNRSQIKLASARLVEESLKKED